MSEQTPDYSKMRDAELHAIAREGAPIRAGIAQAEIERRRREYEDERDTNRREHEIALADKQLDTAKSVASATKAAAWAAGLSALGAIVSAGLTLLQFLSRK